MILVVMFLFGLALVGVGLVGPAFIPALGGFSAWVLMLAGVIVLIAVSIVTIITRLYRKASANMAFVRTGMGGAKVIKDGGTVVMPVVHQVIPVSLETMRLNVDRRGPHALITKDNLRVDLSAEFYIKVQANENDILQAARSLGGRNVQPDAVSELVEDKLVSALRTVAATKELVELHSKRDEFATAVQAIVTHDLSSNGLSLESVTISSLDQTDPSQLQEKNVFDAQGLRKIAEITQKARVERNEIEREAEQQVAVKNVAVRKNVLDLAREQAEAEAQQKMQVANVQAAREREIAEFKIVQDESVARREIEKQRQIQISEVAKKLAVEQAEVDKQTSLVAKFRLQQEAEIAKKQALEVAERTRQSAIAQKEQEVAAAQALMLAAESEREAAQQRVTTVTVTAEAQREAEKKLIGARQEAEQNKIKEQTNADVIAYTQLAQAKAEKEAAEMRFAAKLKLADGDAAAATKRAEGDTAIKMVDVNVERQRVSVNQAQVEVERQSLANKSEFEDAALKFELEKLRIQADKEVRIAAAQAMANMFAKANMQIFGDPATMTAMSQQFMKAAAFGNAADGLLTTLPTSAKDTLISLGSQLASQLAAKKEATTTNGSNGTTIEVDVTPTDPLGRK